MPNHDDTPVQKSQDRAAELRRAALEYHEFPTPGKLAVVATKQMINQHDLALAYSPGVAAACEEIVADPANAFRYTARGSAATWWPWSPTARPCWAWETSDRWRPSR
mgnify:CR=1 FL=1